MILVEKCREVDSDSKLEEVIERAHLALLGIPRDAKTLQGIGEQLCDQMDFELGIEFCERAMEAEPDNDGLKKKLKFAGIGLLAQQGNGRVFIWWGTNSRGRPAKTWYADRSREGFKAKGPAGSSKWAMPSHSSDFNRMEGTGEFSGQWKKT